MELTFQKSADRWIAEFEAHADFNLHIEGVLGGSVSIFQRGTDSGGYAYVNDATLSPSYANVYDYDFTSLVYPKFIKVSCATEPTFAAVTTDGEITEIKAQSKEIEVTSNGTMDITPDAGFAYLNSVKVKTNVAQSGESGGGSTGGDGWVYFDLRNSEYRGDFLFLTQSCPAFLCGIMEDAGGVMYGMTIEAYNNNNSSEQKVNNLYGMAMYLGGMIKVGDMQLTNEEYINTIVSQMGITNPIDKAPRITKEEFYNLNA